MSDEPSQSAGSERGSGDPATRHVATPLHVAILDGLPVLVAGLRSLLARHSDLLRLSREVAAADVIIADVALRHGPFQLRPVDKPLVVIVREGDREATRYVRQLGATPVSAAADAHELVGTIQRAYTLQLRPSTAPREASNSDNDPIARLSPREVEVLNAICAGMSNTEIAKDLFVSINSVKTYIRSAYRKMGVSRRSQAILWGLDRGYGPAANEGSTA